MPFITSTSYALRSVPRAAPTPSNFEFPVDTLIAYDGNDPLLSGWTRYSAADGFYLSSTTNNSLVGTTTNPSPATTASDITLGSSGGHTGTTFRQWITTNTGSAGTYNNSSGGDHTHSASYSVSLNNPEGMLNRQTITFLRATAPQKFLPVNALVFKDTQPANSQAWGANENRYLKGANNNISYAAGTTQTASFTSTTGTAGGHNHFSSFRAIYNRIFSGWLNNYDYLFAGDHSHVISGILSQSTITSKLFKLWKFVTASAPTTDTIVMYVGSLSSIPSPWFLCDGNNGTVNIGNAIIGYNNVSWNGSTVSDAALSAINVSTMSNSHNHSGSLMFNSTNILGPAAQHTSLVWSHTHTAFANGIVYGYVPGLIRVAFIQFKG